MRVLATLMFVLPWIKVNTSNSQENPPADQDMALLDGVVPQNVVALLGGEAQLPCPLIHGGRLYTVLWYKSTLGEPFYTFDGRERDEVWSDSPPRGFGDKAQIRIQNSSAVLFLSEVDLSDTLLYRCRVDYKSEQTKNHFIDLTVVVPPVDMTVYLHGQQRSMKHSGIVTGLQEDQEFTATCTSHTGKPLPSLIWYLGNTILDQTFQERDGSVYNSLTVPTIPRDWADQNLTCQAKNNNISSPLDIILNLHILTYPAFVSITGPKQAMSANKNYSIQCESEGSRPAAHLAWSVDHKHVQGVQVEKTGNKSISTLIIPAHHRLDGLNVSCSANNPKLRSRLFQTFYILDINYPPIVELRLGVNLNPDQIIEGSDVYFQCLVIAKPTEYKIEWYWNDLRLEENSEPRTLITENSLVLQGVSRVLGGRYQCRASNLEGDTLSNYIHLNIQYGPSCSRVRPRMMSLSSKQPIQCRTKSHPKPSTYRWIHNSTKNGIIILQNKKAELEMNLLPGEGSVQCFARNTIGEMKQPCRWKIVDIGVPDPPENCRIQNQTSSQLNVHCTPGWSGGLDESFQLEVWEASTERHLIRNISNPEFPRFIVNRLKPGQNLVMLIYSTNHKGRSSSVEMESSTEAVAKLQTVTVENDSGLEVPLGVILGASLTVLVILIIIILFILSRRSNNTASSSNNNSSDDRTFELRLTEKLLIDSRETPILESANQHNENGAQKQIDNGDHRTNDAKSSNNGNTHISSLAQDKSGTLQCERIFENPSNLHRKIHETQDYISTEPDKLFIYGYHNEMTGDQRAHINITNQQREVNPPNIKINPNYM